VPFPFTLPARYAYEGPTLEGGQGTVYICRDKYLDRKVAIKVMKGIVDASEIQKEVTAIQAVRSKHVAQLFDLVVAPNKKTVGLVEEYIPGNTAGEYAAAGVQKTEYLKLLYQIASGVDDIHSGGRIHRDIKPSNIRLNSENVVKILDFGFTSATAEAVTTDAKGTPCYLAPELYGTPPVKFTEAVDTFAFGVTARVLAEGGAIPPPFKQTPPYANPFPSFSSSPIPLPGDLVSLLDACLAHLPTMRPTMGDVRKTLGQHLLFGQHRAMINYGANTYELSSVGKSISLQIGGGGLVIQYDGLAFRISSVTGAVYINNFPGAAGATLPDSCVITLGAPWLGGSRTFVPFNVSHPEVVL